jgi:hypothetical protein
MRSCLLGGGDSLECRAPTSLGGGRYCCPFTSLCKQQKCDPVPGFGTSHELLAWHLP